MELETPLYSYAQINLTALKHNFKYLCGINKNKIPICVLKDDAYGHEAEHCAKALCEAGAKIFAVSSLCDALKIKNNCADVEIIVLGYVAEEDIPIVLKNEISVCVYSVSFAQKLNDRALIQNTKTKVHIALNTGLNRLGFSLRKGEFEKNMIKLLSFKNLDLCGLYTHFAEADGQNFEKCAFQIEEYKRALNVLTNFGKNPGLCHISNSGAAMWLECECENAFRAGISLFGISPLECKWGEENLIPVMSFKTRVANILKVNKGDKIGYGGSFTSPCDMKIAVLCAGFAQGYFRALAGKGHVKINKENADVIAVCMDMTIVDISKIKSVKVGDIAELFGEEIKVRELCEKLQTVSDEMLCAVGNGVLRVFSD